MAILWLTLAQISHTLHEQDWNALISEDSLTSTYFTVLQMLRVATEKINYNIESFTLSIEEIKEFFSELYEVHIPDEDYKRLSQNRDTVISLLEKRRAKLLERIRFKKE